MGEQGINGKAPVECPAFLAGRAVHGVADEDPDDRMSDASKQVQRVGQPVQPCRVLQSVLLPDEVRSVLYGRSIWMHLILPVISASNTLGVSGLSPRVRRRSEITPTEPTASSSYPEC